VEHSRSGIGVYFSNEGGRKVKTAIIALSAAALIAAAPAVSAPAKSSKSPRVQHNVARKLHPGVSGYASRHEMQDKLSNDYYSGAFGYGATKYPNPNSGGGGGGGGGM
jgi:hypothetical protein